jgi:phenylacetate-CoA ligase
MVRGGFDDLQNDQISRTGWRSNATSGSTGTPLVVIQDQTQRHWIRATETWYYNNLVGMDLSETPRVMIWGSTDAMWGKKMDLPNRINLFLSQADRLGASRFTPAEFSDSVRIINRRRPKLIQGYAGSVYEMARHVRDNGLRIHSPEVIVTTAENLLPEMRSYIEEVFQTKVRDLYGTREMGFIAGECSHGRLHRFTFHNQSEIVDENAQPVAPGETGDVVVTTLHNRAMPLLRYTICDRAVAPIDDACPCGCKLPSFGSIAGRSSDYFPTISGDRVYYGYFLRMMGDQTWVKSYLIVQIEIDAVEVRYVPVTPAPAEALEQIEQRIRLVMGEKCRVIWKSVDQLPPTKAGKRQLAIPLDAYQAQQNKS